MTVSTAATAQHVMHPDDCILRPLHTASDDWGIPRARSPAHFPFSTYIRLSRAANGLGIPSALHPSCNVHATSGAPVDLFQNRCLTRPAFSWRKDTGRGEDRLIPGPAVFPCSMAGIISARICSTTQLSCSLVKTQCSTTAGVW